MSKSDESGMAIDISVGDKLAGKYLTFKLALEEYGLEILKVQEIIQMQAVTRVRVHLNMFVVSLTCEVRLFR